MGVLNVTPDSFSDGGQYATPPAAVPHGLAMVRDGADLVDVGGESTRPGAQRPSEAQEAARVLPVVEALASAGVAVSIDTMRASVAAAAVAAGAVLVNDVSGGLADEAMLPTVAHLQVPIVLMHWRGHSQDMQSRTRYDDVVAEVADVLRSRVAAAEAAGVDPARIVVDPGIGFAKTADQSWELMARLTELAVVRRPVLVGASRKSFLGALLATADGPRPVAERVHASVAVAALAATLGVWCVRAHDVRATVDAVAVAARMSSR
jgi:dihydropteroate synthase